VNALDIYSKIENHLDFNDEIAQLHDFYLNYIEKNTLNNVLDVGCGQGDIMFELKNRGINVFGIDTSQAQIDICIKKELDVQCSDLKTLSKEKTYDVIIAVFDVLNYIPKQELKEFFGDIKKHLNKDGVFIFDVNTRFGFEEVAQGTLSVDNNEDFTSIDALFDEDILYTTINYFFRQENNYNREKGVIKQYYHSKEFIKKVSKMKIVKKVDFYLHVPEEEGRCDKEIYVLKI
jgi:cyclopropane fatty-acyl-phospholipid synthase-like methyltransferase